MNNDVLTAKENILKKIRQALSNSVPLPFPAIEADASVFVNNHIDNAVLFAEEFSKLQGKFIYCSSTDDLKEQLRALIQQRGWQSVYCSELNEKEILHSISITPSEDLASCDASVTGCEFLVSRTGSILLSSAQIEGRTASVYAPIHICIADSNQLVFDIKDALVAMKEKYDDHFPSFVTFASGPSRTADIEKTLVTGVHGPKEVFCFMVE